MHKKVLFALIGFTLLTVLLSACRIIDASTIPQNPKATMGINNFIISALTIKKGQSVDLVDTVAAAHVIGNGQWANGKAEPGTETGAPAVSLSFSGNETKTIGPFNSAGVFHIYCSIHPGMNLVVTVQ